MVADTMRVHDRKTKPKGQHLVKKQSQSDAYVSLYVTWPPLYSGAFENAAVLAEPLYKTDVTVRKKNEKGNA